MLRTSIFAALAAALVLAGCASNMTQPERLALYESNASEPLTDVAYFSPQGWEKVDSRHVVVMMRPREQYLLRLSGPCLDYDNGAATLFFSSQIGGFIQPKFDRITFAGSPISCRIEEIRGINVDGVRAAMDAREAAT